MSAGPQPPPSFQNALLAGGIAGTTVDMSLFPLDTLKTRLQSREGFFASGGFRGIYRGIGSALVGSAPGAAFFFCTYETTKSALAARRAHPALPGLDPSATAAAGAGGAQYVDHMLAASLGEVAACAVRVPTEVIKQRAQAGRHGGSSLSALLAILHQRSAIGVTGVWRELYRGWGITVFREVPFTIIQFPLWEALKAWGRQRRETTGRGLFGDLPPSRRGGRGPAEVSAAESGFYGSLSGAIAAGITTPLDVLKTRVMLSAQREGVVTIVQSILKEHGVRPFFAGIGPRVMWISAGGAIFLGSYQWAMNTLESTRGLTSQ